MPLDGSSSLKLNPAPQADERTSSSTPGSARGRPTSTYYLHATRLRRPRPRPSGARRAPAGRTAVREVADPVRRPDLPGARRQIGPNLQVGQAGCARRTTMRCTVVYSCARRRCVSRGRGIVGREGLCEERRVCSHSWWGCGAGQGPGPGPDPGRIHKGNAGSVTGVNRTALVSVVAMAMPMAMTFVFGTSV
jgi:hypothetical protein